MTEPATRFLGLLQGELIYEGDTIEVMDVGDDWVPARLLDVELGDDGLPRFVAATSTRFHVKYPMSRVGKVLYSRQGPHGPAAKSYDQQDREHQAALAEEARKFREVKIEAAKAAVGGPFSGSIKFAGLSVTMDDAVVFQVGEDKAIGTVVGYRPLGNLLLVATAMDNYAVAESEFLGVLQTAPKD